jgi:shikimate dehydrogenase
VSTVYLLGHPVAHSLSPAMHNAAFRALGLGHTYEALDVSAAELPGVVGRIRGAEIGAANTLSRTRDGRQVIASNTDVVGFEYATRDLTLDGARVLVLGAGGAARAVVAVLFRRGAHVALANRTDARARTLARSIAHPVGLDLQFREWASRTDLVPFDAVVNATSLGLHGEDPLDGAALRPGLAVVDLVPTAAPTPLVKRARAAGATVVDGLPMLLQQAASSFRIWTGQDAPVDAMRAALFASVS